MPTTMRVVTYNIRGWRTVSGEPNLESVARVLAATEADIIGLNEVFYPRIVEGAPNAALEALAQRLQMYYVFGACLRWPVQNDLPATAYGNALLSRWPIIASAGHHLTPVAGKEQRGLLEGRIQINDQYPFTVYVTHLDHTNEQTRLVQLRAVRTWTVRDRNRPHIVLGDFNAISGWDLADRTEAQQQLAQHEKGQNLLNGETGPQVVAQMEKAGYTDVFRLHGEPGAQSFLPLEEPQVRIDYIFVNAPLVDAVTDCCIWMEPAGKEASDHRPVLAILDYPR